MGLKQDAEIDAWLREGGIVVTASDRAARSIAAAYHRTRRTEGLEAWPAPRIVDWQSFAREAWRQRSLDGRLLLNPLQEQVLWAEIAAQDGSAATTLDDSRRRLAGMAMEAHSLLCSYAQRLLETGSRAGWQQDAAAFSRWVTAFDEACRAKALLSASRVPLELIPLLRQDATARPPVLLAGFDRLLPTQKNLFDTWGSWRIASSEEEIAALQYYAAPDERTEFAACAAWCTQQLDTNPSARLLVLTQDAAARRGEIERALLGTGQSGRRLPFEFSLGVPLDTVGIARSASMILRWLDGSLQESEVDWLVWSEHAVQSVNETRALQAYMNKLRDRGLQRVQWTLSAFLQQKYVSLLPGEWVRRMLTAQRQLQAVTQRSIPPLDWAELIPQLLQTIGWPGERSSSSSAFQAARRFQQVVDACGSLGFDGRRMSWKEFIDELNCALADTLFAPESEDAPILIAGPAESAGLTADGIWFLGATEDAWPAQGSMHPLLPVDVQRAARMPHALPQLDWDVAQAITARVAHSARDVRFSFPQQADDVDARASRLVVQIAGTPSAIAMPDGMAPSAATKPECIEDVLAVPLESRSADVHGGSAVLTSQSQCGFKAFATARLGARGWDRAQVALTAAMRGNLVHDVLHAIWGGPPNGIGTLSELVQIQDRRAFVAEHVAQVMKETLPASIREQMPQRYLELEQDRLTRLISEWLDYEAARVAFTVAGTEMDTTKTVAGLTLRMRLDRIDRLSDGTYLVVDYKTGDVSQKLWDLPRPEDVQLPLYAGFALEPDQELGGLVFAKLRPGDLCFTGRVGNPATTLGGALQNFASLKRNALDLEHLLAWRDTIEKLARDFLAGRADVDPRDPPQTCERCGLYTLCRIQERDGLTEDEVAENTDE